jgi:hypothetical protein
MGMLTSMGVAISMPDTSFDERWSRFTFVFGPAVLAALLILPLFLFDCIRYSNRFAGPLKRLSEQLKQLAETGHAEPISIRENDFWSHLVTGFNRLVDESAKRQRDESGETTSIDLCAANGPRAAAPIREIAGGEMPAAAHWRRSDQ